MNANTQVAPASVESLSVISYQQQPVVTTELLARLYGTDEVRIRQNFTRNAERFVVGKHFIKLEGEALREFKDSLIASRRASDSLSSFELLSEIPRQTRNLTLWTERGAARHAKMLDTEQAWEVFEKLEDCYFAVKLQAPESTTPALPHHISQEQYDLLVKTMNSRSISRYWQRNVWKALSVRFNIEKLRLLLAADFNAACAFILNEPLPKTSVRKLAAPKTSAAKVLSLATPVDIRAKRTQQALTAIKGSKFMLSIVELPNGRMLPDLQYIAEDGFVVSSMNSIHQILAKAGLVAVPKEALQGLAGALKGLSG